MPQEPLDGLHVGPRRHRERGRGVPQIMRRDAAQAGRPGDLDPTRGGRIASEGSAASGLPAEGDCHDDATIGVEPGDRDVAAGRVGGDDLVVDEMVEPIVESLSSAGHAG